MTKRSSTPTDESRLAKWIVDQLTIETEAQPQENLSRGTLGRIGGLKAGRARAEKLSSKKRQAIDRKSKSRNGHSVK